MASDATEVGPNPRAAGWPAGGGDMGRLVRARDWAATPLGAAATWPQSLRTTVELTLGSPVATLLLWGPSRTQIYNDRWRDLFGDAHSAALGRPVHESFPDIADAIAPPCAPAQGAETITPRDVQLRVGRRGMLRDAPVNVHCLPAHDESGSVAGVLCTAVDPAAGSPAKPDAPDAGSRAGEERLRALVAAASYAVYRMSPDWRQMYRLEGRGFLASTESPREDWGEVYLLPEDRDWVLATIEDAIRRKHVFELEHRVRRPDGSVAWTLSRAVPILSDAGDIVEWFGAASDVTARRAAETALRDGEERFRSFAEHSADTIWIVDLDRETLLYLSPAFERTFGENREAILQDLGRWARIVHPDDLGRVRDGLRRLRDGAALTQDYRIVRPRDGAVRWIRDTGFGIRDENGRITRAGGIAQDVTEARISVERQAMLLAELQHRVRNTLAVIRSIARRTAASSETVEDYALELDGRLNAFARVQAAVTRNPAVGIDLEYLVADELHAHSAKDGEQVRIEGPAIRLQPKPAETLGLAFHELATNAVKHGALNHPSGRIRVTWRREKGAGGEHLVLEWKESGVKPRTTEPARRGFGTDLLLRTIAYDLKGKADHVIEPDGLRYTVDLPLSGKIVMAEGLAASASPLFGQP